SRLKARPEEIREHRASALESQHVACVAFARGALDEGCGVGRIVRVNAVARSYDRAIGAWIRLLTHRIVGIGWMIGLHTWRNGRMCVPVNDCRSTMLANAKCIKARNPQWRGPKRAQGTTSEPPL